ncbi:hypothetical protein KP509_29G077000 [Ceratopteris richardii]|uniref:Uncharacterized protein n=1 Tax=Ceratopteris richardii TaxID=49495 RepID=A0A8T2R992_CERRI|nr:hypothetical protein KP509_29G077000 [Ceratopteris richardii]
MLCLHILRCKSFKLKLAHARTAVMGRHSVGVIVNSFLKRHQLNYLILLYEEQKRRKQTVASAWKLLTLFTIDPLQALLKVLKASDFPLNDLCDQDQSYNLCDNLKMAVTNETGVASRRDSRKYTLLFPNYDAFICHKVRFKKKYLVVCKL